MEDSKMLKRVSGTIEHVMRSALQKADKRSLKNYLESRGIAVYANEDTASLRVDALDDYDSEGTE